MITPEPHDDSTVSLYTFSAFMRRTAPIIVVIDGQAWSASGINARPSPGGQHHAGNTFATFGATLWPCPPAVGGALREGE